MTLKDLILKYEFDTIVPDLIEIENPVKDNLYAFKEAFDTLRRMGRCRWRADCCQFSGGDRGS